MQHQRLANTFYKESDSLTLSKFLDLTNKIQTQILATTKHMGCLRKHTKEDQRSSCEDTTARLGLQLISETLPTCSVAKIRLQNNTSINPFYAAALKKTKRTKVIIKNACMQEVLKVIQEYFAQEAQSPRN